MDKKKLLKNIKEKDRAISKMKSKLDHAVKEAEGGKDDMNQKVIDLTSQN